MTRHSLYILGSGAAKPSLTRYPSSQLLDMRNRQFLIDCGEGCQIRIRQMHLSISRMNHIFISHLHGDHCFGLMGLISTLGMDGRTQQLHIHAHEALNRLMTPWLKFYCNELPFKVVFEPVPSNEVAVVYDDDAVRVTAFPLQHRIAASGFRFDEKPGMRHLLRDVCDAKEIPIAAFNRIKQGEDYTLPDGTVLPNNMLTTNPTTTRSYAYCTDTRYTESIIPHIEGVDLMFHDSTYDDANLLRADKYFHSTASQAADIAAKAHAKRLILGHFSNRITDFEALLAQARSIFPNTDIAADMTKVAF